MTAILLMAYGSPRSLDEVGDYLRDIRNGREVTSEAVAELTERYRHAGCPSPLLEITQRQAAGLSAVLGDSHSVYVGMKHWHPYIRDAVAQIAAAGHERVIGIALAPHFSQISIGGYAQRVRSAQEELSAAFTFTMVEHWFEQPALIELVARNVRQAAVGWRLDDVGTRIFFTAHSLPERILSEGDPYPDQLISSAKLIADAAGAPRWEFAFQSASATGEPWLGPDILQALDRFAATGGRRAIIAPVGFLTDHLEILYDVDVECATAADRLGIEFRRVDSPNGDPMLTEALAALVRETESKPQ